MEEIKIGEYVRDTEGEIYKADEIFLKHANVEIKKHSFNIKDLIEKGDFVNGYEVDDFDGYDEEGNYFENDLGIPIYDDANMDCIVEYRPIRLMEIKSIVTREMFQNIEYRVESN